uniref:Uncharacterized protein n=1 Tax=Sciurus vulgaris TaxID=55149 RepID=A0A8D2AYL6_SCIVU
MYAPPPPPPPPVIPPTENEHDEHDENNAEASAELSSEGVMNHRSEEEHVTETQKNERIKKQLQCSSVASANSVLSIPSVHTKQKVGKRIRRDVTKSERDRGRRTGKIERET